MSIRAANGSLLSKTGLQAKATTQAVNDTLYTFTEDIFQDYNHPGKKGEKDRRLLFKQGQTVNSAAINDLFKTPSITSVTPNTGPIAGGTNVTVKGTNLSGTSAITFGGVAATNVAVVDEETVTCTTPATTAGAKTVAGTDDSGAIPGLSNGFTYV
jgi:hypothetical protein